MRRTIPLALSALLLCVLASAASAQTAAVDARAALSRFPDSQAVLYVNANRVVNVAMPRLLPPAEYQKMLDQAKKVGFDARGLEYAVIGIRFGEGAAAGSLPEFVSVVRGSFNADSLLALARLGLSTQNMKLREEAHGSKTMLVFDTANMGGPPPAAAGAAPGADAGGAKKNSFPFPEVAAVSLDANTLVVGVPAYVRAAIDAAAGRGGLKAATLDLAVRDPFALWSLTADLPPNLPQYLQKAGVPANEEMNRMVGWLKSLSFSMGMDAANFTTKAAVMTDTPEHAGALDGMLQLGLTAVEAALRGEAAKKQGDDAAKAKAALSAIQSTTHTVQGSTLEVGVAVPQEAVVELLRKEMTKGQQQQPAKPKPAARKGRAARRR